MDNVSFDDQLRAVGINLVAIQAGKTQGLFEIVIADDIGVFAADNVFRVKHYTKEIIIRYFKDRQTVFMTKPFLDPPVVVCGQAFNHSISRMESTDNAFTDSGDPDGISQLARFLMAGLVKHARGLTALCSPTVNCYRRLHGPSSPCTASASDDDNDQTSAFSHENKGAVNAVIENRLPGGSANPYIVLAATVAARLAGIIRKYPQQDLGVDVLLPKSLSEALDALERDEVLVEALGEEFLQLFIRNKREFEVDVFKDGLTDESIAKERKMYLKMF